ncbi:MAG: molybdenum cofactor guanylyltransferase [Candidatus Thermoplasmatota archaeon]|nr:molybdenum cofactor guanylyltransferase [Candidatus Thermoplasmatota archaeon]MBU1914155.1 molybdenum cofactor guanylyltransferase [Candidatus Thermoplasmatota archaeon]
MGQDKGMIRLGGRPLVNHVATAMAEIVDEIVVAVAAGKSAEYTDVLGGDLVIAEDKEPDLGPLEGLITALSAANGDYVLFSPCDTPFLKTGVCKIIASYAKERDGAVPIVRGYQEPLHAVYRRTNALEAFEIAVSTGKRRPADAYEGLVMMPVPEDMLRELDPRLESFWNLNTPEDLAQAEAKLKQELR